MIIITIYIIKQLSIEMTRHRMKYKLNPFLSIVCVYMYS